MIYRRIGAICRCRLYTLVGLGRRWVVLSCHGSRGGTSLARMLAGGLSRELQPPKVLGRVPGSAGGGFGALFYKAKDVDRKWRLVECSCNDVGVEVSMRGCTLRPRGGTDKVHALTTPRDPTNAMSPGPEIHPAVTTGTAVRTCRGVAGAVRWTSGETSQTTTLSGRLGPEVGQIRSHSVAQSRRGTIQYLALPTAESCGW